MDSQEERNCVRMKEIGDRLALKGIICNQRNNDMDYIAYELNPTALMTLFKTLLEPLFIAVSNDEVDETKQLDSAAWQALHLTSIALTRKIHKLPFNFELLRKLGNSGHASMSYLEVPCYIAEVIQTIGPVPGWAGRLAVPYLDYKKVEQARPDKYYSFSLHTLRYLNLDEDFEPIDTGITMVKIDLDHAESSPWWTFHVFPGEGVHENKLAVYSPVKSADVEIYLKFAVLFAGRRLTFGPGPVFGSGSPTYDCLREDLENRDHPSWKFPIFDETNGIAARIVETIGDPAYSRPACLPIWHDSIESGEMISQNDQFDLATSVPYNNQRHDSPARDFVGYRVVYLYFDHITMHVEPKNVPQIAAELAFC